MTKMLLGKGMHQSKSSHNLIITLETEARIGQLVADEKGRPIGKVLDIFGPVEAPYASIRLNPGIEVGKVSGKPFFIIEAPRKKKRSKKRRKRQVK